MTDLYHILPSKICYLLHSFSTIDKLQRICQIASNGIFISLCIKCYCEVFLHPKFFYIWSQNKVDMKYYIETATPIFSQSRMIRLILINLIYLSYESWIWPSRMANSYQKWSGYLPHLYNLLFFWRNDINGFNQYYNKTLSWINIKDLIENIKDAFKRRRRSRGKWKFHCIVLERNNSKDSSSLQKKINVNLVHICKITANKQQ